MIASQTPYKNNNHMQLVSILKVFQETSDQLINSSKIKLDLGDNLIYCGSISRGCVACYKKNEFQISFSIDGERCNYSCPFCYSNYTKRNFNENDLKNQIQYAIQYLKNKSEYIKNEVIVNFSAEANEPLSRINYIQKVVASLEDLKKELDISFYYKVYTNGYYANDINLNLLNNLGINELRFNIAASMFKDEIYNNVKNSKNYIDVITIETPLWEPYREFYFSMIEKLKEIQINHLILGEVVLTKENIDRVLNSLENPSVYLNGELYLYNKTLFYDIYKVYNQLDCKFSILYCNSTLKSVRDLYGKELLK